LDSAYRTKGTFSLGLYTSFAISVFVDETVEPVDVVGQGFLRQKTSLVNLSKRQ
jgi:hypothetical protein